MRQRRYEFQCVAWNYKIAIGNLSGDGRCIQGRTESLFCHISVAKDVTYSNITEESVVDSS